MKKKRPTEQENVDHHRARGRTNLNHLSNDCIVLILSFLPVQAILNVSTLNSRFNQLVKEQPIWLEKSWEIFYLVLCAPEKLIPIHRPSKMIRYLDYYKMTNTSLNGPLQSHNEVLVRLGIDNRPHVNICDLKLKVNALSVRGLANRISNTIQNIHRYVARLDFRPGDANYPERLFDYCTYHCPPTPYEFFTEVLNAKYVPLKCCVQHNHKKWRKLWCYCIIILVNNYLKATIRKLFASQRITLKEIDKIKYHLDVYLDKLTVLKYPKVVVTKEDETLTSMVVSLLNNSIDKFKELLSDIGVDYDRIKPGTAVEDYFKNVWNKYLSDVTKYPREYNEGFILYYLESLYKEHSLNLLNGIKEKMGIPKSDRTLPCSTIRCRNSDRCESYVKRDLWFILLWNEHPIYYYLVYTSDKVKAYAVLL